MSARMCVALLCLLMWRLFMCLLVQHVKRWRHVLGGLDVHSSHVGEMSSF